jgi:anti-anti-sigma factor
MDTINANVKVIQLTGILDGIRGSQLRREVGDLIQAGTTTILIDFANAHFMDSSGLGALVMIMKATKQAKGQFAICSINDQIRILLELTSMDKVLAIFPDQTTFLSTGCVTKD